MGTQARNNAEGEHSEGGASCKPRRGVRATLGRRLLGRSLSVARCWQCRVGIGVPVLLVVSLIVVAVAVPNRVVLPVVSRALGLEITADRMLLINRKFEIVIEGLRVRVPGIEGRGGEVARARLVRASYDWTGLFSGGRLIDRVELYAPVVRISQDMRTGELNIEAIRSKRGGTSALPPLPELWIRSAHELPAYYQPVVPRERVASEAAVEIGEHDGVAWKSLWRIPVSGRLVPSAKPGIYAIELEGVTDAASDQKVVITGRTGVGGTRVEVRDVALSIDPSRVPSRTRETFRAFDLRGTIPELVFTQAIGGSTEVMVSLEDVAMNLPFGPRSPEGVRLQRTFGTLRVIDGVFRGELDGYAEDVPYSIAFETGETDASDLEGVPFSLTATVRDYRLPPNPPVVPFLPPTVQVRLDQFSNPTGIVTAQIRLRRGEPGGRIVYEGDVDLREGRAAYYRFPYVFEGIEGRVSFGERGLVIESIRGRAATGASVHARGSFAPLDGTSEVRLDIDVRGVPIDETLLATLSPERRAVVDGLFSQGSYEALAREGFIRRSEDEPGAAPVFTMGGRGDVSIRLHRELGEVSRWTRRFSVAFDEARLVPEWYRAPIVARGVEAVLTESSLESVGGSFVNVLGGRGRAQGSAVLEDPETGRGTFRPDIRIEAEEVGVGAGMVAALRGVADGRASEIIDGLGLRGKTSGGVHLRTEADGSFGFEIEASLDDVASTTTGSDGGLTVRGEGGSVVITPTGLDVGVRGVASANEGEGAAEGTAEGVVPFEASTVVRWSGPEQGRFEQGVSAERVDLALPLVGLIDVFSPELAGAVAAQRARFLPQGRASVEVSYASRPGRGASFEASLREPDGFAANLPAGVGGGRFSLEGIDGGVDGSAAVSWDLEHDRGTLAFEGFRSFVLRDGVPEGRVELDGTLAIGAASEGDDSGGVSGGVAGGDGLRFDASTLRFESSLIESLASAVGGDGLGAVYREFRPEGVFGVSGSVSRSASGGYVPNVTVGLDGISVIRSVEGVGGVGGVGEVGEVGGAAAKRVFLDRIEGGLRVEPGRVVFDALTAVGDGFVPVIDGDIRFDDGVRGDLELLLHAWEVSEDLVLLLPNKVGRLTRDLEVSTDGSLTMPGTRVRFEIDPDGGSEVTGVRFSVDGALVVEDAAMKIGTEITGVDGLVRFDARTDDALGGVRVRVSPELDEAKVAKVRLTEIRGTFESSDEDPGVFELRELRGRSHGGRASLDATLGPGGRFESSVVFADVGLAGVRSDLEAEPGSPSPTRAETGAAVGGRVLLRGRAGDVKSFRGRGEATVRGGTVLQMPLSLALIRAGHFRAPLAQTLDDASVRFHVVGPVVAFETISLTSGSVSLFGFGTMTIPDLVLDLRFITRAGTRLPVVSDVFEGLRDELVTATVRGPIEARTVGTEQFGVSRRLLRELLNLPVTRSEARFENDRDRATGGELDRWRWGASERSFEPERPAGPEDGLSASVMTEGEPR